MPRATLQNFANSRAPHALGLCNDDFSRIASYVNEAQQNLINAGGETGWWGGWARVVFNVAQGDPYITLPSRFARAVNLDYCRNPVSVQNEWYEFLEDGIGLQNICPLTCGPLNAFDRGFYPTAYSLTTSNQYIRVYITDSRDVGKRIAFTGALDQNGNGIYSTDVFVTVPGFYITMGLPFVTSSYIVTAFTGVIKDVTFGDVIVKQVDATSGTEVLLARYGPNETNPQYRRYLLKGLPAQCCDCNSSCTSPTQVTVMAKYDFVPAVVPTDFLLISNIPALKAECESIRYGEMDDPSAAQLSLLKHQLAISLLNKELTHYFGTSKPAINVAPFGSAKLERQAIGALW